MSLWATGLCSTAGQQTWTEYSLNASLKTRDAVQRYLQQLQPKTMSNEECFDKFYFVFVNFEGSVICNELTSQLSLSKERN